MATTVVLQQDVAGYVGCGDTFISDFAGGFYNNGGSPSLVFGYEGGYGKLRTLMRWDLSSIPSGSTIVSATLQLYDRDYVNRTINCPIKMYAVSAANSDWLPGSAIDSSQDTSAEWIKKAHFTTDWAGSQGLSTPTTDYVNTSLGAYTFLDAGTGFKTITFNAAGLTFLQGLFGSTGGGGFIIIADDETTSNSLTACVSSDDPTVAQRPILTITYDIAVSTGSTFQNGTSGYVGCQDTFISNFAGGFYNNGASTELPVGYEGGFGKCRILMRWDLTAVPGTAVISSASLKLYDTNYAARDTNTPVKIYAISDANMDWVVGTAIDASEDGSSSWLYKKHVTDNWAGSVGLETATTDYINTSLGAYTFVDAGTGFKQIDFNAAGIAYLQGLLGGSGAAGFMIFGDDETISNTITAVKSSNHATVADRPILTINYTTGVSNSAILGAF